MKKNYQLQGMSCGGCVKNVKQVLLGISGVENADVQLNPPNVLLTMHEPISIEVLQAQLSKAGNYTIKESLSIA